jgi:mRNA interferase MazF
MKESNPQRGEIWLVNFDPTEGNEIQKLRPAVVINRNFSNNLDLFIVLPITSWKEDFSGVSWLYKILPDETNHLDKVSTVNCYQIRTVSKTRLKKIIGKLAVDDVVEIVNAVGFCIGL